MCNYQLSEGSLQSIFEGDQVSDPVVQVLDIDLISNCSNFNRKRYKLLLSDGKNTTSSAVLTLQPSAVINVNRFSIIRIKLYTTAPTCGINQEQTELLILMEVDVIADGDNVGHKIGNPTPFTEPMKDSFTPPLAKKIKMEQKVENPVSFTKCSDGSFTPKFTSSLVKKEVTADGDYVGPKVENPVSSTHKFTSSSVKKEVVPDEAIVEQKVGCNAPSTKPLNASFTHTFTPSLAKKESKPFSQLVYPIAALTPSFPGNDWTIKARVVNKSDMRFWSNAKGTGNFFTFDLMEASGEIRCTAFYDMAKKFYDFLEVGKVYLISNCELKLGNPRYNQLKNAYEMSTTKRTTIKECDGDMVPQIRFDFIRIAEIAAVKVWSLVDVMGVCVRASEVTKTGKRQLLKREILLVDRSKASIEVTLWGSHAENFDDRGNPVLAIKGAQVGEFAGGKNLSVLQNSHVTVNPSTPECHLLKGWYACEGKTLQIRNISQRAPLVSNLPWATFKKIQENETEDKLYHQTLGTILWVQPNNFIYKGCPNSGCFKKVHLHNATYYECTKCARSFDTFNYRLSLSVGVGDWQSVQEVNMFEDVAEKVLGKTSKEVGCWMEKDEQGVQHFLQSCTFKQFLFKCKTKESQRFDQVKQTVVVSADPINYEQVNTYLVERVNQLLGSK